MVRVSRSSLRLLSIAIGILFIGAIYYSMHYRIPWEWDAPGVGKLPRDVVSGFLEEAYGRGNGEAAVRDYFASEIVPGAVAPQERSDAGPIPYEIHSVVAQGLTVVVFQKIGAARGQPATDVVDVFEVRDGRIVRRERHHTGLARNPAE